MPCVPFGALGITSPFIPCSVSLVGLWRSQSVTDAPTDIDCDAVDGEPTLCKVGPALPAAMDHTTLNWSASASTS